MIQVPASPALDAARSAHSMANFSLEARVHRASLKAETIENLFGRHQPYANDVAAQARAYREAQNSAGGSAPADVAAAGGSPFPPAAVDRLDQLRRALDGADHRVWNTAADATLALHAISKALEELKLRTPPALYKRLMSAFETLCAARRILSSGSENMTIAYGVLSAAVDEMKATLQ